MCGDTFSAMFVMRSTLAGELLPRLVGGQNDWFWSRVLPPGVTSVTP